MQLFFQPCLMAVDFGLVWVLIKGHVANKMCGNTHADLRMGVPAPVINFDGMSVTLNDTQRVRCYFG
jgi:hypothetical protein